jgi:hypothetical protein
VGDLPNWVQVLLGAFAGGAGCYAAIRADLADLKARTMILEHSNSRAHERIDSIQLQRRDG